MLKGKWASLVMASGFQTDAAVLQCVLDETVLGAEPLVFADRLNHASTPAAWQPKCMLA